MYKNLVSGGFTLIELSIVLVIIGLLVGGILTGQDLIKASEIRSQISQLEKINTAVNSFKTKYNQLPGDMAAADAAQWGFQARNGSDGSGNGDGVLRGRSNGAVYGWNQIGENTLFWRDLSQAGLIENTFNTAIDANYSADVTANWNLYFPSAKIDNNNYLFTYSTSYFAQATDTINYLQIFKPTLIYTNGNLNGTPGLTRAVHFYINTPFNFLILANFSAFS